MLQLQNLITSLHHPSLNHVDFTCDHMNFTSHRMNFACDHTKVTRNHNHINSTRDHMKFNVIARNPICGIFLRND